MQPPVQPAQGKGEDAQSRALAAATAAHPPWQQHLAQGLVQGVQAAWGHFTLQSRHHGQQQLRPLPRRQQRQQQQQAHQQGHEQHLQQPPWQPLLAPISQAAAHLRAGAAAAAAAAGRHSSRGQHHPPPLSLSMLASLTLPWSAGPACASEGGRRKEIQGEQQHQHQQHLQQGLLTPPPLQQSSTTAVPAHSYPSSSQDAKATSREDLGRATWTLLHMLAAQFPEEPTRQQRKDARQLINSLTRVYPCSECAAHWGEIVRRDPPAVGSGHDLRQWMCRAHNAVNRSLGKPAFNCAFVEARWAPLDCGEDEDATGCDMTGKWGAVGKSRRGKQGQ